MTNSFILILYKIMKMKNENILQFDHRLMEIPAEPSTSVWPATKTQAELVNC